jgi:hypothetical protein
MWGIGAAAAADLHNGASVESHAGGSEVQEPRIPRGNLTGSRQAGAVFNDGIFNID